MKRVTFKIKNTIHVFRYGKTSNAKISDPKTAIMQSFTFSVDQLRYVTNNYLLKRSNSMHDFFALDGANCLDCPFSFNTSGKVGLCYTHKFSQYRGFISMLKSIAKEFGSVGHIKEYNKDHKKEIIKLSLNKYVRFGSYGEPSLHPIDLVESVAMVAKNWTGYTHQFRKRKEFAPFFMASVHNDQQAKTAKDLYNYRSFISYNGELISEAVQCPASKEAGFKSVCSLCSLCSGNNGKGVKDVKINIH